MHDSENFNLFKLQMVNDSIGGIEGVCICECRFRREDTLQNDARFSEWLLLGCRGSVVPVLVVFPDKSVRPRWLHFVLPDTSHSHVVNRFRSSVKTDSDLRSAAQLLSLSWHRRCISSRQAGERSKSSSKSKLSRRVSAIKALVVGSHCMASSRIFWGAGFMARYSIEQHWNSS